MPDFHVVALKYRLQPSDHVSYSEPPPLFFENETARFHLEKNQLRCEMKLHVATSEQARALVDPVLRDWEMEVELTRNRGELRFIYEDAEIIDRTPSTPGAIRGHVMVALGGAYSVATANAHLTSYAEDIRTRQWVFTLPRTPKAFCCDSAVTKMVANRFCRWRTSV